jgi:Rhs element Vgr protein
MAEVPNIAQSVKATDRVSLEVLVAGKEVANTYQMLAIDIWQEINKIPAARLVISDGESNKEDFTISSSNEFKPGTRIEIKLGYKAEVEKVFSGVIISNSISIKNRNSELVVEARDAAFKMTINKGNRYFTEQTDSDIAGQLLDDNGLTDHEIENSSPVHKQLVQSNITDWDFMISRIDASGMFCVIDNAKFNIRKPDVNAEAKLSLTYGDDILNLSAEMDSRLQATPVQASGWDFASQSILSEESDPVIITEESIVTGDELAEVAGKPFEMRTTVSLKQEELKAISNSKKVRQALSKIRGIVTYQGINKVLPGDFILLNGIGSTFSGKVFVSAVHHEFAEGDWISRATLGWVEDFFAEQINPSNAASSTAQISGIQGLQAAIVTDIVDSEGEYRVKIRFPAISENEEGVYARIATLDAGNNRGTFFRPEIDDEVIVGFMNNDVSHPVILGMLHSSPKPSPLEPANSNNEKGYISRSGMKLVFNDGGPSVKIETPAGRVFELDDAGNTITISDGAGNKILMELSGITIEAAVNLTLKAGASLSLAAPQLSVKADGIMNVEGSGGLNMKSGGVTVLQGSLIKIN